MSFCVAIWQISNASMCTASSSDWKKNSFALPRIRVSVSCIYKRASILYFRAHNYTHHYSSGNIV